jgi:phosphoglycolate phosphatase-like HAD superfamily hydrolase
VLFDIDGTLVRRAGPHHRQALVEAVRQITGLETTTDGIPVQGMLDPDILAIMMRNASASELLVRRHMAAIVRRAQVTYVRRCPSLKRKVCPGVRSLLAHLRRVGVPTGLVTGNLTRIGWKKLERAGLKHHFCLGAFGEMSRDRAGLVRIAIGRARKSGWVRNSTRISLIGDSPADIQAARANRVQAIAVLTGISTPQELAAESPDMLIKDLRVLCPEELI